MADNKTSKRKKTDIPINEPLADFDGRKAPRDVDIEKAVLGALMLERDAFSIVSEILSPASFYEPRHQIIYTAVANLGNEQRPIDMLTVTEELRKLDQLEEAGGTAYIAELTGRVSGAAHLEYHARILSQKFIARELISFASKVGATAFDESYDVQDLLQEAEGALFTISQRNIKKDVTQINPVIKEAMKKIEAAANNQSGLSGLQTGFHALDQITMGWQNSDLIIIAARPGMGKTGFVLSMAKNMAVDYNTPVALFSLEMSDLQLVNRLISLSCDIDSKKIRSGQLTTQEMDRLMLRIKNLYGAPLYIDDTPSLSITELSTKARRLVREHSIKMIIIDYLQLMNASGLRLGSREQEVSTISRSLKQLAKELNIPIIALSQLNRDLEKRGSASEHREKRPQLSDLRESGAIEQDADIVCFIHRPEKILHSDVDADGKDIRGLVEFIIAKHRNGSTGDIQLRFVDYLTRFENWTDAGSALDSINRDPGKVGSRMNDMAADTPFSGGTADFLNTSDLQPPPF